jgi:hypothetical protein
LVAPYYSIRHHHRRSRSQVVVKVVFFVDYSLGKLPRHTPILMAYVQQVPRGIVPRRIVLDLSFVTMVI